MKKRYLISPGPTPVPERVALAMARPIEHHRTPGFSDLFASVATDLKALFHTDEPVITLSSSGTGAMEASVTNLFSPREKAITINGGKFGERWGFIARAYGLEVESIDVQWGSAVTIEQVRAKLDEHPDAVAIFAQASETSTTVSHPICDLARLARDRGVLLIVDAITAIGVDKIEMDNWGIDVLIGGSQKAFMLPPGLSMIALSARARARMAGAELPRFYFDLTRELAALQKKTSAYTPAVSLISGLRASLDMMFEEGLENLYARHAALARAARAGVRALGLKALAPEAPANCATGFYLPPGIDGAAFLKSARDEYGVTFAGGQDQLKGKIVRIAHIGYFDSFDILIALGAIEMALEKYGEPSALGVGVAAAERELIARYKPAERTQRAERARL